MSVIPEFYTSPDNVNKYIAMTRNTHGTELLKECKKHLPLRSSLLELGTGPGNDFLELKKDYEVLGSDLSPEFLRHLKSRFPQDEFLNLDATTLETSLHFDAIYSNKVLHHLKDDELRESIDSQVQHLHDGGLICHAFWKGNGSENFKGMYVNMHTEETLTSFFAPHFKILHLASYMEFEEEDSLLLIARKKS